MSNAFVVGFGLALLVGVPLLGGILIGQLSVWNWLHKRYGLPRSYVFYEWLDDVVWEAKVTVPSLLQRLGIPQTMEPKETSDDTTTPNR